MGVEAVPPTPGRLRKRLGRDAGTPRFKPYDYDQHAMVAINCLIIHKLDLSVFRPNYRNDNTSRCAYGLLKLIPEPHR